MTIYMLMNAFSGSTIRIPSVVKTVGQTTAFSDKFSFQHGSVNFLLFWLTNQNTANGVAYSTNNNNSAIIQRAMGKLKNSI